MLNPPDMDRCPGGCWRQENETELNHDRLRVSLWLSLPSANPRPHLQNNPKASSHLHLCHWHLGQVTALVAEAFGSLPSPSLHSAHRCGPGMCPAPPLWVSITQIKPALFPPTAWARRDLPIGLSRHIGFLGVFSNTPAHLLRVFGIDGPVLRTTSPPSSHGHFIPLPRPSSSPCPIPHSVPTSLIPPRRLSPPETTGECFDPSATCSESRCLAPDRWPMTICWMSECRVHTHRPSKGALGPGPERQGCFSPDKAPLSRIVCRAPGTRRPLKSGVHLVCAGCQDMPASLTSVFRLLQVYTGAQLHGGTEAPSGAFTCPPDVLVQHWAGLPVLLNKRETCVPKARLRGAPAKVCLPYLLIKGQPHFPLPGPCGHTTSAT